MNGLNWLLLRPSGCLWGPGTVSKALMLALTAWRWPFLSPCPGVFPGCWAAFCSPHLSPAAGHWPFWDSVMQWSHIGCAWGGLPAGGRSRPFWDSVIRWSYMGCAQGGLPARGQSWTSHPPRDSGSGWESLSKCLTSGSVLLFAVKPLELLQ